DTAVVDVTADGEIMAVGIGTAMVTATDASGGDASAGMRVSVAELAANTVLLASDWLISEPVLTQSTPDGELLGGRLELSLSSAAPSLATGDRVVADDWSVFGRVVAVDSSGATPRITVETTRLEGFFDYLDFRSVASLADMTLVDENATAAVASSSTGNGVTKRLPGADRLAPANLTIGVNDKFTCKATTSTNFSGVASDIDPSVDILLLDTDYQQTVDAGSFTYGHLLVNADLRVHLDGKIDWNPDLTLKITCTAPIQPVPTYQHGPLVIAVPVGLGFELDVTGNTTIATVQSQGFVDVTTTFGIRYTQQDGFSAVAEGSSNSDNIDVSVNFTELSDIDSNTARPNLDIYGFAKPRYGLGFTPQLALYVQPEEVRIGNTLGVVAAGTNPQLQQNFASGFDYDVYGKRIVEDPFFFLNSSLPLMFIAIELQVLQALTPLDFSQLLSWTLSIDVDENPRPDMAESPSQATQDETTALRVRALNANFLAAHVVDRVEVYRVTGSGLSTSSSYLTGANASPGQTVFALNWTPGQDDADAGTVRLVPVLYSSLLPGIPIVGSEHLVDITPTVSVPAVTTSSRVISYAFAGINGPGGRLDDTLPVQTDVEGVTAEDSYDTSAGTGRTTTRSTASGAFVTYRQASTAPSGITNEAISRIDVDLANLQPNQAVVATINIGAFQPSVNPNLYANGTVIDVDLDFDVEVNDAEVEQVSFTSTYEVKLANSRPDGQWHTNSGNTVFDGQALSITLPPVQPPADGTMELNLDIEMETAFFGAQPGSVSQGSWNVTFSYEIVDI
ncbi:MAG: hypothetical protein R3228_12015, partial [Halioglobus sp.]|nr:hypothetical protein [Halioglobus sp.]